MVQECYIFFQLNLNHNRTKISVTSTLFATHEQIISFLQVLLVTIPEARTHSSLSPSLFSSRTQKFRKLSTFERAIFRSAHVLSAYRYCMHVWFPKFSNYCHQTGKQKMEDYEFITTVFLGVDSRQ